MEACARLRPLKDDTMAKEIRLNAFEMNCVAHQSPGMWHHPRDRSRGYRRLDGWVELAKTLERGLFDGLFPATFWASMTSLAEVPRRRCVTRRKPQSTIRCFSSRPWRPSPSISALA
jgi:hypothetical protein